MVGVLTWDSSSYTLADQEAEGRQEAGPTVEGQYTMVGKSR